MGCESFCCQRHAQASRSRRNRGRTNRANAVASGLQIRGKGQRGFIRSQHDRHDVRVTPRNIKAVLEQRIPQKDAEVCEVRALRIHRRGKTHSGGNLRGKIRRQGRVENKSARAVDQETAQRFRTADESAGGRECLAACVHRRKHAAGKPRLRNATAACRAAHSGCVGFVHDQFGVVACRKRCKFPKRRAVAIHAEDAFDHDESRPGTGMTPAKFGFESVQIEMRENDAPAFRKTHAINEAGMIGAVREDSVIGTEDGAQQSDIRRIAGSEIKRGLSANPSRKIMLKRGPGFVVAG